MGCSQSCWAECQSHPAYCTCPVERGQFPIPEDCSKWCHCDDGVGYIKDCPACNVSPDCPRGKLYFDPYTGRCEWPKDVPYCSEKTKNPDKCADHYVDCTYWEGDCGKGESNWQQWVYKHCPSTCRDPDCSTYENTA